MDQFSNIANLIIRQHGNITDKVAIKTPKERFTYNDLQQTIGFFALHMQHRGVNRSSCVAIDTNSTFLAIASTLAVALLGCRWVQASQHALQNDALGITHLLHDGSKELPHRPDVLKIEKDWLSRPPNIDPGTSITFDGYQSPDDTWMISRSSGTTGTPKFMTVSHRLFSACIKKRTQNALLYYGGIPPISMSMMHPLLRTSLATSLSALKLQGTVVAGGNYGFWQKEKVNTVQGSPVQIIHAIEEAPIPVAPRIPQLRASGASCAPELIDKLFDYFDTISVGYGSTEADNICRRVLKRGDQHDGRLGKLFDDVDLQIVSDNGEILKRQEEGIIRIRTGTQVSGYIGDAKATAAAFKDGWFYPGDIGRLTEDGELIITGRVTDVLNLGGGKINATIIDSVITACSGVVDGISFAKPNSLGVDELSFIIKIEENQDKLAIAQNIRGICESEMGIQAVPKYIYFSDNIPKNEKMKPLRHEALNSVDILSSY